MRAFSVEKIGLDLLAWLALPHFHRGAKPAWTLAAVRVSSLFRLAAIYVCLLATCAYAAVTVTPATGGTNILADKAANATSPAWTPLGPIIIKEGNKFDFSSGANLTLVLKAPSGFEFNTSAPPNIAFTSGVDISAASVAISNAMTITVTLTVGGTSGADQLTIGNINAIQVRPTAGTPLATGQIFRPQSGGGTAVINGITTSANTNGSGGSNFGSLSESVGVAARLAFMTQPGSARTGAIFGTQPVVKTQDQFGNNSTMGLASSVSVSAALTSGTGPLLGTTTLNIGSAGGNGTVTYTNLEIDVGGTNKQLTASASGLTSALSALFTVNSPPTISNISNLTTNEDQVATNSFTISDQETPADSLILLAISSNTSLVANTNIVFGGAGNNRSVTVYPSTNGFGTSTITISVNDGSLSSSNSFLLTVNAVNEPPTLNALTNWTIPEDAGTQTVNLSGISPGPSNESTQTVTITASSSNPSLIPNPTVNYTSPNATGTLTFAPLTNQFGSATITVVLNDDGSTANGGIDSLTNSFIVTVLPVNDPPTLDPLSDVSLGVNAGLQTIALTGISPGPGNESTQIVTITASSSNPGLIPNPTVNYSNPSSSGTLTFTPVNNAGGTAIITVTNRDNGGTANGGQDTITRQFAVTVSSLSDLSISQVAIPNPGFLGGTTVFQLTVTNAGPTTATAIQVTNALPAGIGSVSVTSSQGNSTNYGAIVVCSLGNLTNGGVATVNVTVEPLTPGFFTNSASVWSSVSDPNLANNSSSTVATVVAGQFVISSTALVSESCTNGGIDPAETVTVSFALQNTGSSDTTNLVATLKATGGVMLPSGPQTYGVLTAGGPAISQSFTFTPLGNCGGTFTAVLQLQDGAASLGTASRTLTFGQLVNRTTSFSNSTFIAVPSTGAAVPYPSTINVSGLNPNLLKVTATLNGLSHSQPHDLEILLVGPGGQKTWVMSDCGGINVVNNITLTFDNAAASALSNQGQLVAGTFKPTDFPPDDVLPAPAPAGPYVADLSLFNGTDPNGAWQLYVFDDTSGFSGNIARGWTLNVTTLEPACCIDRNSIDVTFARISAAPNPVVVGNNVTFTIVATNQGPATATGVSITNPIPPNAIFVSASSSQGSCSVLGGAVVCSLGSLTNAGSAALSVTFQTTQPGTMTNSASISANEPDHALSNNVGAGSATVSVPAVTIGNATVLEGNSGTTTNAIFTLQLSAVSSQTISVNYATTDITATAGSDYVATNGTVVFAPGQTTKTVAVTVIGDNLSEATEFFGVALTNPINVTLGNVQGTGTIIDDDPLPTLSISDASVIEGNSGTTNMLFTVTVSPVSGQMVNCNFDTANGSALAGSDYVASSGTLTIPAGQTTQTIAVPVIGDTLNESNETFFVNLSGVVNANLGRSQGIGTIINDDFIAAVGPTGASLVTETCSPANGVIDPNETVTVSFGLRIISPGTASTTNLVATLLQTGGITAPGGPQTYGVLSAGGPSVSRSFTFTANGTCGDTLIAVLQLQDGVNNLGTVTNFLTTGKIGSATNTFSNSTSIMAPDIGTATPYPSGISVSGVSGTVTKVTASLVGLTHTYPSDFEILLVGPGGQAVLLMSDAGDGMAITNINLTFDDAASQILPAAQIGSGTYKPTDYPPNDTIPAPAPPSPYGTNLSVFNGIDPTGTWSLYVYDDSPGDSGSIAAGWTLTITTLTPPVCCGGNSLADLNLGTGSSTTSTGIGSNLTYTINVTNLGPNTASDVVLVDALPSIASFLSATNSIGTFNNANGIVTFNLGTMTNGARASMSVVVMTTTAGYASNIVTVSSRAADPNPANNSSLLITAVSPPVPLALFTANPSSGNPPLSVTFSDGSLGSITNHFWSFGDGRTTNTSVTNFVITYPGVGTNTVSLTVTGPGGTNTLSQTGYIVVTNLPPKLVITPTSLDFGSVQLGQTPTASFQVVNSGGLPLSGNATVSLPFSIQSGSALNLSPGQTGMVVVGFSPSTVGNFTNAAVFSSNGGNSTNAVTGSGFTPAQLAVSPQSLSFGTVAVGSNLQASFTATNSGSLPLTNGSVTITAGPFSIISSTAFSIAGFGTTNVVVRFTPASEGSFTNVLAVTSQTAGSSTNTVTGTGAIVPQAGFVASQTNGLKPLAVTFTNTSTGTITNVFWDFGDGSNSNSAAATVSHVYPVAGTNTVLLSVSGPLGVSTLTRTNYIVVTNLPPQLALGPANLDFGAVIIGQTNTLGFQLTNTGGQTLTGSVAATLPFRIEGNNSFNLAPGSTGQVMVSFAPTGAGSFSNVVRFNSNGGNSSNSVIGVGLTPAQLGISPQNLNFGSVAVGSNAELSFVVTNLGAAPLSNATASVTGGPFSLLSGTSFSLAGFGSTNALVRFSPTTAGSFSNGVVFTTANAGSSTNPVFGTGAVVPAAAFTGAPTNGRKPLTVTFTNQSTGTITNLFWDFGDNSITNTTAGAVSHFYPNAGTYNVTLTVSGPVGADISILTNYITVTNLPPTLSLGPASLDFGPVIIGQTNTRSFQLTNLGDLTLTGTVMTTPPFAIQNGGSFSLTNGQTAQVLVGFAPDSAANFSNVVVFTSNGGNSTNPVIGSGLTSAQLAVSPPGLDFGTVPVGSTVQANFVVTNLGGATLSNGTASLSPGTPEFTILSGTPFSLPGFGSTNVVVRFSPTNEVSFSNVVLFATVNNGNSTNPVTGVAAVVPTAFFIGGPTSGVAPLQVTLTNTSLGTITNVSWDFGDGSTTNTAASTVSHLYPFAATNTLSLSVSGPLGASTLARTNYIVVTNPPPMIVLSTNVIIVPEGSSNSFTVMLSRPPDNDVAVTTSFTSGGTNLSVVGGGFLAFSSTNWNIAQPVFIGAIIDPDTVNEQAQFTLSSPGLLNQTITAIEADKDLGLIVSTNALTVPEGSTNSFTVQLNNQPGSEMTVSVAFASGDTNLSVADGATLIFNASNWNVPQSVLIAAAEDNDNTNGQATFALVVSGFTNQIVTVTGADNDMQSLVLCPAQDAAFSMTPAGTGPFSYVWRKDGSEVAGETNNLLVVTNVSSADAGVYSVEVSGPSDAFTNSASLTVLTNISASAFTDLTNCPGSTAVFSTTPSGTGPFNVAWWKDGSVLSDQTNHTLTIPSVTAADAGSYSVTVSGGCSSVTNSATLTVLTSIGATPLIGLTNCPGTPALFSTTPSGSGPFSFVWRQGGSVLSGQTDNNLTLTSVTSTNAGTYSVEVGGACGSVTNRAILTVLTNVGATPLASQTNCPGIPAFFSTTPSGSGPFSFLWRKDGGLLSLETNNSLALPSVASTNAGSYSVSVSGACGSVTNSATLTVLSNVSATQLISLTNCPGSTATFSTTPSGSGPFRRVWRKDGNVLSGQTNNTLTLPSVTSANAGIYSVTVSGACGSVTNSATLTVLTNVSATQLISTTNCPGDATFFNTTPSGSGPFSFVWRKGTSLLNGQTNNALTLPSVASTDAGTYSVTVSGACGSVTNSASLTVLTNVSASALISRSNCPGSTAVFSTTPSGTGPFSFVWRKDGNVQSSQSNSAWTISLVSAADAGTYSVTVSNACGSVTNSATLTVLTSASATALSNLTNCPGDPAVFITTPSGSGPFSFVWRKNGSVVSGQTNNSLSFPSVVLTNSGTYSVTVNGACGSVTNSATLTVLTNVSAMPLSNLINCPGTSASFNVSATGTGLSYQWYKAGSSLAGQTTSNLTLNNVSASDAGTYSVVVSGVCGTPQTNSASLTINQNVSVSSTPVSLTNCPGTSASFSVSATGSGLLYQWYKGTSALPGKTGSSLTLNNVSAADAGTYSVAVSGACGTPLTNSATLAVLTNVSAMPLTNLTNCPGTSASFSVSAIGTGLSYQWYKAGSALGGQTSSSLILNNVSASDAATYSVIVSGVCGNPVTNSASLTVNQNVSVSNAPVSLTNCPGTSASFSVSATGTGLSYQWYKGSSAMGSQTTSSLTLNNVSAVDAGTYSVVVSGVCGNPITNSAILTMNQNASVSSAPVSVTNCPGTIASFSVSATGTGLSYQWYKGSSALGGQTSSSLTLNNVSASDAGTYNVVVSGICGNPLTNSASLTLNQNVAVSSAPASLTNCPGTSASFSVSATGTGLSYQWYKGSSALAGQTSSSLTLNNVSAADGGTYSVAVSGACGSQVTNSASLTVNQNVSVSSAPVSLTNCPGTSASFSVSATGTGLSYQWYKGSSAMGSQTTSSLTLNNVSAADAGTYSVVVSGVCGNPITNSATLTMNQNVSISSAPVSLTNCPGTTASFSVSATGPGLSYQWYKAGSALGGQTSSSLTLNNVSAVDAATYSVVVGGACGNPLTNSASLTLNQNVAVSSAPVSVTNCAGTTASFSISATGTGLSYQWYKGSSALGGQTTSSLTLNNVSVADAGTYSVVVSGVCGNPITNSATLTMNQNVSVSSAPINLTNCPGTSASFSVSAMGTGLSYQWYKAGSALGGQTSSSLILNNVSANDAGTYNVVVSGICGNPLTNSASLTINQNVAVSSAPVSVTNCPGTTASFSVSAKGTGLSYQWYKAGSALSGQTNSNLTLNILSVADAGTYSVVVSGACGSPLTNSASLTINQNVAVSSAPASLTNCPGTSASFSVSAMGTGLSYQWYKGSSAMGSQTTSSLTLNNVSAVDAATYSVIVSGVCGNPVTNNANLTVNQNVAVSSAPVSLTNCPGTTASFSVSATGTGLSYQWYKAGSALGGQTSSSLTLNNVSAVDAATYSVIVSGVCGNPVANSASLTINQNVVVSSAPVSLTNCPGASASFSVSATGTGLSYQWYKDSSAVAGQTGSSLALNSVSGSDAGTYSVAISGLCGNPVTNSATLTTLDGTRITPLMNRTNAPTTTATFSTIASGSGPFSYRWMKDGAVILGQTNDVLTIASVTMADAGVYTVDVTGSCDTASSSASLTVDARLVLSPINLDFGVVIVGQTSTQSFQLFNSGGLTLTGSVSAPLPFAIQSGSSYTLTPGQTGVVTVSFSPVSAGSFNSAVAFASNGGNSTNAATGIGLTPAQLSVSPARLDFGTIAAGSFSQSSLSLTNLGGAPVSNGTATVVGGPFRIISGTPFSLPGFGSTNLMVRFSPLKTGNFSNVVVLTTSNGGGSTNSFTGVSALPPIADFSASPTNGSKPLLVTFSDSSTGTITNWLWDFGDGTTSNSTRVFVSHTYQTAGTNTITLTATGPLGSSTRARTNYIIATNPLQITTLWVSAPDVLISFSSKAGQFYRVEYTDSLLPATWKTAVDFVLGNGDIITAIHLGGAGRPSRFYRIRLLTDLELAPAANFTANPALGQAPLKVTFVDTSTGYVTNRFWDFGDGSTTNTTAATVSHIYSSAGTNTVRLTVTGPAGTDTRVGSNSIVALDYLLITAIQTSGSNVLISFTSKAGQFYRLEYTDSLFPANWKTAIDFVPGTGDIVSAIHFGGAGQSSRFYRIRLLTALDLALMANFSASPTFGQTPLFTTFVDSSTGYITNRFWNFGDGSTTNTMAGTLSHIYSSAGTNTVTLTVSGPFGTSTSTHTNYIAAINPLLITSIRLSASNVIITFTSSAGQFYRLEYADALPLSSWSTAVDSIAGTGGIVSATHLGGAISTSRFYRLRLLP